MPNPIVSAIEVLDGERRYTQHRYWCSGCNALHAIGLAPAAREAGRPGWDFSGTLECPTYAPSQLTTWGKRDGGKHVCHTFIRAGQAEFLGDCTHALAGQTVPLPPLPDWVIREERE